MTGRWDHIWHRLAPKFVVDDGCWTWIGARDPKGYGQVRTGYGKVCPRGKAHRVMYEQFVGPIPAGLQLDHLCRNPSCVRPDHLEPVTHGENLRRGNHRERRKTHCKHGHEFTPENTRIGRKNGARNCRECQRIRHRRYRARDALYVASIAEAFAAPDRREVSET